MTDFDDSGIDLPDDDLTGGPDLSDLDAADEVLDLDIGAGDEFMESSGGARADATKESACPLTCAAALDQRQASGLRTSRARTGLSST